MTKPRRVDVLFAALGDEVRLALVRRLCEEGPKSISSLANGSRITRQAVTKHLRVMEKAGLARCRRSGRESVWELETSRLEDAKRYLDRISHDWDDALLRLKRFVED